MRTPRAAVRVGCFEIERFVFDPALCFLLLMASYFTMLSCVSADDTAFVEGAKTMFVERSP